MVIIQYFPCLFCGSRCPSCESFQPSLVGLQTFVTCLYLLTLFSVPFFMISGDVSGLLYGFLTSPGIDYFSKEPVFLYYRVVLRNHDLASWPHSYRMWLLLSPLSSQSWGVYLFTASCECSCLCTHMLSQLHLHYCADTMTKAIYKREMPMGLSVHRVRICDYHGGKPCGDTMAVGRAVVTGTSPFWEHECDPWWQRSGSKERIKEDNFTFLTSVFSKQNCVLW